MESAERNRKARRDARLRLWLYAMIFALTLAHPIVEMKTGYPIGHYPSTARIRDPLPWEQVWPQLPGTLALSVVITAPLFALIEWSVRRKEKGRSSILDSESEASDSPAKPLTRRWRIATIVYFAAMVLALYVYSRGNWGWDMPPRLPLAAFAPILISLGLLAVYAGEFQLRGGVFYRRRNPIWYWACVGTMLVVGLLLFLAGIGAIGT
jgi:hypothetical protein